MKSKLWIFRMLPLNFDVCFMLNVFEFFFLIKRALNEHQKLDVSQDHKSLPIFVLNQVINYYYFFFKELISIKLFKLELLIEMLKHTFVQRVL